ncbi:MAG: B12-binding domain-containing radical SAM protein [Armatimonadetes bacterium]|nr:B12-binding domain-containing radical SAM protein [Armatimonadota bacterium]
MRDFTLINFHHYPDKKYIPLGCLYLISTLKKNNFKVNFIDLQFSPYELPLEAINFLKFLKTPSSNIIGFSCMSDTLALAVLSAKALKENYKNITIIFGGAGPTGTAKELIKYFSFIDIVIRGEGEKTLIETLKELKTKNKSNLQNIPGINYRKNKTINFNPPQERIKNLDTLPFPSYEEINLNNYDQAALISSRGCPYNCAFCDLAYSWKNKVYYRSIENLLKEIKLLVNTYNFKEISIKDDIFTLSKKRIKEFCDKIKEQNLKFNWSCFGRINLIDKDLISLMAESGCRSIFYGIESGSNKILKKIKKGFIIEEAHKAILESLKYLKVTATFIWGFPFEEMADFYQTVLWMIYFSKLGVDVGGSRFIPYASSPLYQTYKNKLEFKKEFLLDFLKDYKKDEELLNLIKNYPHIFPNFYRIKDKNYKNKEEFIKQIEKVI